MTVCIICHFETLTDDVVLRGRERRCVCLSCFLREAGERRPMPKLLEREVREILDVSPAAQAMTRL